MPRRTSILTAALASAALAAGLAPAAASADKPLVTGKALSAETDTVAPSVLTGRPDSSADGRKN